MEHTRLLIGSSVCQKPSILEKFLASLQNLDLATIQASFLFIDDNQVPESKELLGQTPLGHETTIIDAPPRESTYHTDETTHHWENALLLRVASLKNGIIAHAIEHNYDYLFLIDSDLIINPKLILHLLAQKRDILSELFWTSWTPDSVPLPNVWMYDKYALAHPLLDAHTQHLHTQMFLDQLRTPGVYEVGGLGACTLIAVPALKKGLNFSPIKNLTIWGEDRWFCIRAAANGFSLYVDTHFPATHLYRESDLEGVE